MANELDDKSTTYDKAREYTQRFKRFNPPGKTKEKYVVYAVAVDTEHIAEHFGEELANSLKDKFPHGFPEEATGIRVYKGTEFFLTRRFYLVLTKESPSSKAPCEILNHIYLVKKHKLDLDEIAKKHPILSRHIVCQPDCPEAPSLYQ